MQLIDYQVFHFKVENPLGGRYEEKAYLSVDCFKSFCMLANTERGKQARQYFLQVEKDFFALKEAVTQHSITSVLERFENAQIEQARLNAEQKQEIALLKQTVEEQHMKMMYLKKQKNASLN